MLIVISPAKTLDFEAPLATKKSTQPRFPRKSEELVQHLRKLSSDQISELMHISPKLGQMNYERFQLWQAKFEFPEARQAILAFRGDVYTGLDADTLNKKDFEKAQKHLRILSGLYGVLRPLDMMRPYRLEMGTKYSFDDYENLYDYWKDTITKTIRKDLDESGSNVLVNLASNEYFKSIDTKKLKADIVTPEFKDWKNGQYKMISFWAKKARGMMTRFILQHKITKAEDLQAFDMDGYYFNPDLSKPNKPVFTRDH
ncbi:peroxide stress protein YaaA [Prolixibacter sp. NT017]|uniref:peroxide stress protein YaaA n=1 Tax=Prolixibacter sp. NT017 TaxID=2652390 RepID=UPI0012706E45|nr:peroxide stress protein YaaA [Prolixibacter sp. NT017]GET26115.1 UPF0246 protein [Prolixibacter sp. NT017]